MYFDPLSILVFCFCETSFIHVCNPQTNVVKKCDLSNILVCVAYKNNKEMVGFSEIKLVFTRVFAKNKLSISAPQVV